MQRVTRASVTADGEATGEISAGLVVLLGVTHDDTADQARRLAAKIHTLRILRDEQSVADTGAGVIVVSQFTLYGDASRGNRPSFTAAARPEVAEPLYERFADRLSAKRGVFGARMAVEVAGDGPVTLLIEA